MSKFKTMIRNDMSFCDELISRKFANSTHAKTLIAKYVMNYPDFSNEIISYGHGLDYEAIEIENIKIIKGKLDCSLKKS